MDKRTALIVIDSGFSMESLAGCDRVIAIRDLAKGAGGRSAVAHQTSSSTPSPHSYHYLAADELAEYTGDPLNHGSIVLERLRALCPDAPLVLIRAVYDNGQIVRTAWTDGVITRAGWTEAYLWAVEILTRLGYQSSVANCSFGGLVGAMDGTGWESFQLAKVTSAGKGGHVVVAAAGAGDGAAVHSSWYTAGGASTTVEIFQEGSAQFSLWAASTAAESDWCLEVWGAAAATDGWQGQLLARHEGRDNPLNMWNGRQLLTFSLPGAGRRTLVFRRRGVDDGSCFKVDCFASGGNAWFLNHVDPRLVSEPAVFPHVVAVGLAQASYTPNQSAAGEKPDVLLDGAGPISFRTPEVTARVAKMLDQDSTLTVASVLSRLPKRL